MGSVHFLRISFGLLFSFFSLFSYSQKDNQSCFADLDMESGFIAINTHSNSDLADWYRENLGMRIVKEFDSHDQQLKGIILKKDNFVVEILFRKELSASENSVERSKNAGLMKYGVFINKDLETLKNCLLAKNIKAGRIFRDEELGVDLLLLKDPEGNIFELIQRLPGNSE